MESRSIDLHPTGHERQFTIKITYKSGQVLYVNKAVGSSATALIFSLGKFAKEKGQGYFLGANSSAVMVSLTDVESFEVWELPTESQEAPELECDIKLEGLINKAAERRKRDTLGVNPSWMDADKVFGPKF